MQTVSTSFDCRPQPRGDSWWVILCCRRCMVAGCDRTACSTKSSMWRNLRGSTVANRLEWETCLSCSQSAESCKHPIILSMPRSLSQVQKRRSKSMSKVRHGKHVRPKVNLHNQNRPPSDVCSITYYPTSDVYHLL